jgi:hypothetical protein
MVTEKEKLVLKVLVKKMTKERMKEEMTNFVDSNGQETPEFVERILLAMSHEEFIPISIQYLNYALKYYDDIVSGDFSNDIERVARFDLTLGAEETEIVFVDYTATVITLPSLIDVIAKDFMENPWEYEPDREIIDYGETLDTKWDDNYDISSPSTPFRRIIIK